MTEAHPLNISLDLSSTKTTIPLIADGHLCKVKLANVSQTEKDGKPGTKWEFHLVEAAPTTEGGQVNPGFPLFVNIPLYAKEGAKNPEWFKEKIAKFIDAFLGTGDAGNKKGKPQRPAFNAETISLMIGQRAIAKVSVRTGDYEGNDISSLTFPGDLQA